MPSQFRWMSARELATLWRVPVSTVRRWISEDNGTDDEWPHTRTRPYRYDPEVAQNAYDRRRAGRAETLANLRRHRDRVQGL